MKVLTSRPLMINAYVQKDGDHVRAINWGDDINDLFIRFLTKRDIAIYFDTAIAMVLKMPNYLCIGSTLNYLTTPQTIVWGAGVIDDQIDMRAVPKQVLAVRGPLSRDYLRRRGIDCPEVYGDPALLIPYFYQPKFIRPTKGKIGVIPHYSDKRSTVWSAIKESNKDLTFIDIVNYGKWTDFIDQICDCDAIFSSSLHGLVVAESYGIPSYWFEVSRKVIGNGFKFRDFYASIGKSIAEPILLHDSSDLPALIASHSWVPGRIELSKLLAACPFELKEPIRYEHPLDL